MKKKVDLSMLQQLLDLEKKKRKTKEQVRVFYFLLEGCEVQTQIIDFFSHQCLSLLRTHGSSSYHSCDWLIMTPLVVGELLAQLLIIKIKLFLTSLR